MHFLFFTTILAEDIMQETFVKVRENAASCHAASNHKAWVLTITHNLALNCLKKRGHEELIPDDYEENIIQITCQLKVS